ncbi:MAG: Clp protease N-terminal domain-containing protein [Candidatus Nanoarchaeia archaeon]|nr:Clp protease N-terminal domain-containing protein [Candidatus Nanoarchaeia archaeon]MDD5740394.1 Clp protease N-terminal domain-containing protein [Candidatus Nanoarchaeia archaeon]
MFERFTDRARKVMALANQEAQRYNHDFVGSEHILLGLIEEGSGVGATVLKGFDLNLEDLRKEVQNLVPQGPDTVTMGSLPITPLAKKIVENAIDYSREIGHNYVGTEHLLYGLVSLEEGPGAEILKKHGLDKDKVVNELENLLGINSDDLATPAGVIDYWKIPKGNINLEKFLETAGYEVLKEEEDPLRIFKRESPDSALEVGRLDLTLGDPVRYDSPIIVYFPSNKEQIKEALDLRDLFDVNNVKYSEEPPASEVVKELRQPFEEEIDPIIKRLEKMV